MKLIITSNGGIAAPEDVAFEDGTILPNTTDVAINMAMGDIPRATIGIVLFAVDVIVEADLIATVLPDGKKYRLVEIIEG